MGNNPFSETFKDSVPQTILKNKWNFSSSPYLHEKNPSQNRAAQSAYFKEDSSNEFLYWNLLGRLSIQDLIDLAHQKNILPEELEWY